MKKEGDSKSIQNNSKLRALTPLDRLFLYPAIGIIIVIIVLVIKSREFTDEMRAKKKGDYLFPELSDFKILIVIVPILFIVKYTTIHFLSKVTKYTMDKKEFKNKSPELIKKYERKIASNFFKFCWYLWISIFGYYVCKDLDYLPPEFFGKGYVPNMFKKGYPKSFFHYKPPYFNFHYLFCLSYCCEELFYVLFIYERQSDYFLMILHHAVTIGLLVFSYMANYSNIGSVVLIMHNYSDCILYFLRCIVYIPLSVAAKKVGTGFAILPFIYRVIFLGKILYQLYTYVTWKWQLIENSMFGFLVVLWLHHVYWVIFAIVLLYGAVTKNSFSDGKVFVEERDNNKNKNLAKEKKEN